MSVVTTDAPGGGQGGAELPAARRVPWWAALLTLALAATSIFALLSDLYGVTTMATFTRYVTVPGMLGLVVLGVAPIPRLEDLRKRIRVGAVAGLVGTIGYDLFRIPFVLDGMRLLAPVDSYGLLISGNSQASTLTSTYGWLFHLSNGVTFGVMYAVVAARRHWLWGVAWALVLESFTLLTPFRVRYNLTDMWGAISVAYAAHFFYGWPLGKLVQNLDKTDDDMTSVTERAPAALLIGAVLVVLIWLKPWSESSARREAGRVTHQLGLPAAVVTTDRFTPEWLAVDKGECIVVVNNSGKAFTAKQGAVAASGNSKLCFKQRGVKRVKLGNGAYTGGFVFVR